MSTTRKMVKFCANLSFAFTEAPYLERFRAASQAGFRAVESGYPFGINPEEVVNAKNESGVEQVLLNIYTGDVTKGELGFAAIPGKEMEFRESIDKTVKLATELKVKKIHIMSGKIDNNPSELNHETYIKNIKLGVEILQSHGIKSLIEPINNYSIPCYYMNSYDKALNVIKKINNPNLKIMIDIFHMQQICGDLSHKIKDLKDHIGHVQIAQVPNRNEPNAEGEINYKYVLKVIEESGYDDWIGLEYKPEDSKFKWIQEYGYSL